MIIGAHSAPTHAGVANSRREQDEFIWRNDDARNVFKTNCSKLFVTRNDAVAGPPRDNGDADN